MGTARSRSPAAGSAAEVAVGEGLLVDLEGYDVGGPEVRDDPPRAARRMRVLADAYDLGAGDRLAVVAGVCTMMDLCWRGVERWAAAGNSAMRRLVQAGAAAEVRADHAWFHEHQALFEAAMR